MNTDSRDTLRLANALSSAGLSVWTPVEKRFGRLPRSKARRDKDAPLMPRYVFGRVEHLAELVRLSVLPAPDYPRFSVFRYQGGIPLIADSELDALRAEESRSRDLFARLKRRGIKGPSLSPGSNVRLPDGPFAGISGIVQDQQGQFTMVDIDVFGKTTTIKVASCLFAEDVAQKGNAAQAA